MKLTTKQDITDLIKQDEYMMTILHTVKTLHLPDWWVCAGFVRAKVWDTLHQYSERTLLPDIDVIYFDQQNLSENIEKEYEAQLQRLAPSIPWSVKNEARMHLVNAIEPYSDAIDAMSKFPETATAVGVSLCKDGEPIVAAPCGIEDLLTMTVRPTPFCKASPQLMKVFHKRLNTKQWKLIWPNIKLLDAIE